MSEENKNLVLMVVGNIIFSDHDHRSVPQTMEIQSIDKVLYVDPARCDLVGERLIEKGYDAYGVPSYHKTKSDNHWYMWTTCGGVVAFDEQMQVVVGFDSSDDLLKDYPNAKPINDEECLFDWNHYKRSQ